jgi:hypothetical protein
LRIREQLARRYPGDRALQGDVASSKHHMQRLQGAGSHPPSVPSAPHK